MDLTDYPNLKGFKLKQDFPRPPKRNEWFVRNISDTPQKAATNFTTPMWILEKEERPMKVIVAYELPTGWVKKEEQPRKPRYGEHYYEPRTNKIVKCQGRKYNDKFFIVEEQKQPTPCPDPPPPSATLTQVPINAPSGWEFVQATPRKANPGEYFLELETNQANLYPNTEVFQSKGCGFILQRIWTPPANCPKGTVFERIEPCLANDCESVWVVKLVDHLGIQVSPIVATQVYTDFTPPPSSPWTVE